MALGGIGFGGTLARGTVGQVWLGEGGAADGVLTGVPPSDGALTVAPAVTPQEPAPPA
jgi:hypothetical protein